MRKYLAFGLIFVFGLFILYMLNGFFSPIFAAVVLAIIIYPIYNYILKKTGNKVLSASLIIIGVLLVVIIPLSTISGILFGQIQNFNLDPEKVIKYENTLNDVFGVNVSIDTTISQIESFIKDQSRETFPKLISMTSNVLLSIFIMFFILFYLLTEKSVIINELKNLLPFSRSASQKLLNESSGIIKAVLIGQVLTAVVQGFLGMISFIIVGVQGAIVWGIIMIILSIIPVIGAFIIWVPVGLFLLLEGYAWQGIFVLLWGAIVVSQIDNFIRPVLVNKFSTKIHPLETFLGIFAGLAFFGLIGVIMGPLIFSLFKILVNVFKDEYGDLS